MATIWFSLSGEGRGHATRIRAAAEALRGEHRVRVFAAGAAFDLLAGTAGIETVRIPGMRLRYAGGRLSKAATLAGAVAYARRLPRLVAALRRAIDREPPDLAVCDFEPALPRAARAAGVPVVSLDHQHLFVTADLSVLPWTLLVQARLMVPAVMAACPRPVETIVSSFYSPPSRPGLRKVTAVGPVLRREVLTAEPTDRGHVVAYVSTPRPVTLGALAGCGRDVLVYGLGERPRLGGATFRKVSEAGFVADLASCSAVVCTAGNQLLGEARYLGKPVLAVPEEGHGEQVINAHLLRASGAGDWVRSRAFGPRTLGDFLRDLSRFRASVDRRSYPGNEAVLAVLRRRLLGSASSDRCGLAAGGTRAPCRATAATVSGAESRTHAASQPGDRSDGRGRPDREARAGVSNAPSGTRARRSAAPG